MASTAHRILTPVVVLGDGLTYMSFGAHGAHLALLTDSELRQLDEGVPIEQVAKNKPTVSLRDLLLIATGKTAPSAQQRDLLQVYLNVLGGH